MCGSRTLSHTHQKLHLQTRIHAHTQQHTDLLSCASCTIYKDSQGSLEGDAERESANESVRQRDGERLPSKAGVGKPLRTRKVLWIVGV